MKNIKDNKTEKTRKVRKKRKKGEKKESPDANLRFLASGVVFLIELVTTLLTIGLYYLFIFLNLIPKNTVISIWIPVIIFASCNLVGAVGASVFSSMFLKPIDEAITALQKVASGNFDIRLETDSKNTRLSRLKQSLNETAKQLGSIEVMRNDFTNVISHEFKTPVASIMGYAQRLKSREMSDAERDECIDTIIDESRRLSAMTGNILLLTKLENTGIIPDKTEFALDEQIRQCAVLLQNEWLAKSITLDGELESISYASGEELTARIWTNLLQNAIKFTDDGGEIKMTLKSTQSHIVFTLADNGCGIEEEKLSHIFDKFYQADAKHSAGGNGLGLSIVKRTVDMLGGEISVKSQLGKGTVFTVKLPLNEK